MWVIKCWTRGPEKWWDSSPGDPKDLTCQGPSCLIYTGPGLDHSSQVQTELLCGNSDGPQLPLTNRNGLEQIFLEKKIFYNESFYGLIQSIIILIFLCMPFLIHQNWSCKKTELREDWWLQETKTTSPHSHIWKIILCQIAGQQVFAVWSVWWVRTATAQQLLQGNYTVKITYSIHFHSLWCISVRTYLSLGRLSVHFQEVKDDLRKY